MEALGEVAGMPPLRKIHLLRQTTFFVREEMLGARRDPASPASSSVETEALHICSNCLEQTLHNPKWASGEERRRSSGKVV